jgi:hypothetical protein
MRVAAITAGLTIAALAALGLLWTAGELHRTNCIESYPEEIRELVHTPRHDMQCSALPWNSRFWEGYR